jgi:hypothetical protein
MNRAVHKHSAGAQYVDTYDSAPTGLCRGVVADVRVGQPLIQAVTGHSR